MLRHKIPDKAPIIVERKPIKQERTCQIQPSSNQELWCEHSNVSMESHWLYSFERINHGFAMYCEFGGSIKIDLTGENRYPYYVYKPVVSDDIYRQNS